MSVIAPWRGRDRVSAAAGVVVAALVLGACPPKQVVYVPGPERSEGLPDTVPALVQLADGIGAERGVTAARADRALAAMEKAMRLGPDRPFEVQWRLARAAFQVADAVSTAEQKGAYATQGRTAAEQAVAAEPERVEGHYYLALSLAKLAEARSDTALLKDMMQVAQKAAALDKAFNDAGPLRLMGKTYMVAPAWPTSVGDREEAVEVLKEAVALAPTALNRLFFGEALYHAEQLEPARAQLKRAYKDLKAEGWEARWVDEAADYLRRLGEPT